MKIYTKTGDKGSTSLVNGSRVSKSHARIDSLGVLDEVNAHLGLLVSITPEGMPEKSLLLGAQNMLFNCGARIAEPTEESQLSVQLPTQAIIKKYELSIDALTALLPPLMQFILPGGMTVSAQAHVTRAVVRRCERALVRLQESGVMVEPEILMFVNRLSDWLFTFARIVNMNEGQEDSVWNQEIIIEE